MRSKKPSGKRPDDSGSRTPQKVTPLRKSGPLKPAPRQGVSISFGIDIDDDDNLVIRWPDGSITRDKLDLGDDDSGQPMGPTGRDKDSSDS